ncbi:molybdopterin molybdotransferase MoeA [Deferribacter thermophilus]|uniref:molybdopterin molybdotransferase MoeA n=1 Tax=Deferribacter thermophilus TaxID=53573 RepID=UPI003C1BA839
MIKEGGMMLKYEDAKKIILNCFNEVKTNSINVIESFSYVLAEDIVTTREYPDTKKSAVDGFAIKGLDRNSYIIVNTFSPGMQVDINLEKGEAAFVMTGAVVPENADAVVRVEDCVIYGNTVTVNCNVTNGMNINNIGEEASINQHVVTKGVLIDERIYPVLCYLGLKEVKVYEKPKVGIFTTGNEILEPGKDYRKGFVYNTNRYIAESFLKKLGIPYEYYGNIIDDENSVFNAFAEMTEKYDIIISSGGISMGKYDFVKKVLNDKKFDIVVNKTKIKPGSPLLVAKNNNCMIFGMPGYPAAFFTNFVLYLLPFIKKACGFRDFENKVVDVILKDDMYSKKSSDYFNRATIKYENGNFLAYGACSQKTSHFINFAKVNGFVRIKEGVGDLKAGAKCEGLIFNFESIL